MRLLTRSDFDGICCAVLLKEMGVIEDMVYAHPKDLQDGLIEVTKDDVLANVPYVEGCGMWFDHHSSENERLKTPPGFKGKTEAAPSCARVIYDYYGRPDKLTRFREMLDAVDKVDSARLSEDDIINPKGWVLLGFICDPRTGLGYHREFAVSNLDLMRSLVDQIRGKSIDEIMKLPDVRERVQLYLMNNAINKEFLKKHSKIDGSVIITDTRGVDGMPPGNRFLIYSLFPEANISIRMIDGRGKEFVSFSVGHSILNRTSGVDVGSLMLKYGGGGHKAVGTCQVPYGDSDKVLKEMLKAIKSA